MKWEGVGEEGTDEIGRDSEEGRMKNKWSTGVGSQWRGGGRKEQGREGSRDERGCKSEKKRKRL